LVLLVLGILVLLILILKRKQKIAKKSEGTAKKRNWLLIGCLSIVIPIVIFTVFSPIFSLMDMWGLFAHASRTEIEQAVHRSYQNYGLTGQFELEKYEKNEFEYKIMHFKPYSLSEKEKAPYIRKKQLKKLPEELKTAPGNDLSVADVLCDFTKSNETKRKLTLVIALKSCYYLSEENLSTIARFCRVDFEMFMKAIDSLKLTLGEKQKRYEKLKDKRDFSYYQHRKCMERLQDRKDFYLPTDDIERLCKFHTEKWINKTSFLQNKSYKVCPTNKSIANILGICERQVGYYLNHADDLLKIDKAEVEAAKCQS